MHVTIRAKDLARILSTVRAAVPSRTTMPILSMVLLDARDGQITASGCNLETIATDHAPAAITQAGAQAFPADALTSIVKSLPGEAEVVLRPTDGESRMTVESGRTRARLAVLPADDFPQFDLATSFSGELPVAVVRRLIIDTQFATDTGEGRHYLKGVHLAAANGRLQVTVTDAHRMFRTTADLPSGLAGVPAIIVPREAQSAIAKIIDGYDGDIAIGISEARISIAAGTRHFASKLIDGHFPDMDRVIPPLARKFSADVNREDLTNALKRILAIGYDKVPGVSVTIAVGELRLRMRGKDHETNDAVDAETTGGEVEIGINGKYLLEQLAVMSAASVAIENDNASGTWRLIDEGSPEVHLIMPMRV